LSAEDGKQSCSGSWKGIDETMSNGQQDHPTPKYIRTIFHLGLFGLLSLLFGQVNQSKSPLILGLSVFLAAALPYYPAIWVSRIRSRTVVIILLLVVVVANVCLIYMNVNPNK